jgi:chromosome condensin MukBEF MukE localization factor
MKKAIIEYIVYDDIEEYIIFILKFIIITHLFPIICAVIIAMHQDYLSFFININTKNGKKFLDHEEKLEKYYALKEKEILTSAEEEVYLDKQEALIFKNSVKQEYTRFLKKVGFVSTKSYIEKLDDILYNK